jgi:hypothetical protein
MGMFAASYISGVMDVVAIPSIGYLIDDKGIQVFELAKWANSLYFLCCFQSPKSWLHPKRPYDPPRRNVGLI